MNIRFDYMYRDGGNNKKRNSVIFANRENRSADSLKKILLPGLIDGQFFPCKGAELPDIHFDNYDSDLDYDWYEFESLEETDQMEDDSLTRDIIELVDIISNRIQRDF